MDMGRDITKCHPRLQKLARELVNICEEQGYPIGIGECFRTVQEQNRLYAQGRTKPGPVVTNAPGSTYRSMHQWGIAFDVYRNDGKGAYNESGGYFQKIGSLGKSLGLEWGGDWKTIVDQPHFQLPDWGSTSEVLRKKYGNIYAFQKTWGKEEKSGNKDMPKEKKTVIIKNLTESSPQKEWITALQQELLHQGYPTGTADGIVGPKTLAACPVIRKGARGELTRWIQKRMTLYFYIGNKEEASDGIFGEMTYQNVMAFQKSRKLIQDGIVGERTWYEILQSRGK